MGQSYTTYIGIDGNIYARREYTALVQHNGSPRTINIAHIGNILKANKSREISIITKPGDGPADLEAIIRECENYIQEHNNSNGGLSTPSEDYTALLRFLEENGKTIRRNFGKKMEMESKLGGVATLGCSLFRAVNNSVRIVVNYGTAGLADAGSTFLDISKNSVVYLGLGKFLKTGTTQEMKVERGHRRQNGGAADDEHNDNDIQVRRFPVPFDFSTWRITYFIFILIFFCICFSYLL